MNAEPIDYAAVKAKHACKHETLRTADGGYLEGDWCTAGCFGLTPWPCEPYRLADEAERLASKVARAKALPRLIVGHPLTGAVLDYVDAFDLDAALADQPEQVQTYPCCDATHLHYGQVQP